MIRDIVFEQNYASRVEKINQAAFQQGFEQGRQNGWNELFNVIMHLQSQDQPITQENVITLINQMLQEQQNQEKNNES